MGICRYFKRIDKSSYKVMKIRVFFSIFNNKFRKTKRSFIMCCIDAIDSLKINNNIIINHKYK